MGDQQDLLRTLPAIDRILREESLQNLSQSVAAGDPLFSGSGTDFRLTAGNS